MLQSLSTAGAVSVSRKIYRYKKYVNENGLPPLLFFAAERCALVLGCIWHDSHTSACDERDYKQLSDSLSRSSPPFGKTERPGWVAAFVAHHPESFLSFVLHQGGLTFRRVLLRIGTFASLPVLRRSRPRLFEAILSATRSRRVAECFLPNFSCVRPIFPTLPESLRYAVKTLLFLPPALFPSISGRYF